MHATVKAILFWLLQLCRITNIQQEETVYFIEVFSFCGMRAVKIHSVFSFFLDGFIALYYNNYKTLEKYVNGVCTEKAIIGSERSS